MWTSERDEVVDLTIPISKVKSTILLKKEDSSISSVQDLLRRNDVTYGIIRNGGTESAMKSSNDSFIQIMYRQIMNSRHSRTPRLVYNVHEGIERIRRENFVLLQFCHQ